MQKYTEADIKQKFITPAIEAKWNRFTQIRCEYYFTDGRVIVHGRHTSRGKKKYADFALFLRPNVPVAIIEAKDNSYPLGAGMQQAVNYAEILDIPFAYSSNGSGFLERDMLTGREREISLADFPAPEELWQRIKSARNITEQEEKAINSPYYYSQDHKTPRYYQRIAINRTVEAIARGEKRILITMATGTGKTFTAFQIVWRLWKAGIKKKILYLADRNILVDQSMVNDFKPLAKVMAKVENRKIDSSYEIYFALYHQLIDRNTGDPLEVLKQVSPSFFDLVIVDECHRGSAKEDSQWRKVLEYFSSATHIGMTATPKETKDVSNMTYFGRPIYTYSLKQGIEDGFLAPYKVIRIGLNTDLEGYRPEKGKKDIYGNEIEDREYNTKDFDRNLVIDERTKMVAHKITEYLKGLNERFARTIVFCVDIEHAERMRQALVNENSDFVAKYPRYIMRITGDNPEGKAQLDNFIDTEAIVPAIATTSELLTTGVDCRTCRLIALDTEIASMTKFKQIIGRGTRLAPEHGKEYFTIMDFRGCTRMFAQPEFDGLPEIVYEPGEKDPILPPDERPEDGENSSINDGNTDGTGGADIPGPEMPPYSVDESHRKKTRINGVEVVLLSERVQYYGKDGKLITENFTDYTKRNILGKYATLDEFLKKWNSDEKKQAIIDELKEDGVLVEELRERYGNKDMDDFDLICHIAYNLPPLTRTQRAANVRKSGYMKKYSAMAQKVLNALLDHYMNEGIEDISSKETLTLWNFQQIASGPRIIREFGGWENYIQAVHGLEQQIYAAVPQSF